MIAGFDEPGMDGLTVDELPFEFCYSDSTGPDTIVIPLNMPVKTIELDLDTTYLFLNMPCKTLR
jgi:hypothetical protein